LFDELAEKFKVTSANDDGFFLIPIHFEGICSLAYVRRRHARRAEPNMGHRGAHSPVSRVPFIGEIFHIDFHVRVALNMNNETALLSHKSQKILLFGVRPVRPFEATTR